MNTPNRTCHRNCTRMKSWTRLLMNKLKNWNSIFIAEENIYTVPRFLSTQLLFKYCHLMGAQLKSIKWWTLWKIILGQKITTELDYAALSWENIPKAVVHYLIHSAWEGSITLPTHKEILDSANIPVFLLTCQTQLMTSWVNRWKKQDLALIFLYANRI